MVQNVLFTVTFHVFLVYFQLGLYGCGINQLKSTLPVGNTRICGNFGVPVLLQPQIILTLCYNLSYMIIVEKQFPNTEPLKRLSSQPIWGT